MRGRFFGFIAIAVTAAALGGRGLPPQAPAPTAQPKYDLLLRGGHVIDARNSINAVRDVAIAGR